MTKILMVDDQKTLLDTLRYNLARSGYQVRTAAEGGTGLGLG